jgi:hypothetical protein
VNTERDDDSLAREPRPLPRITRRLAIGAGIVAVVALFGYGWPGLVVGSMPIVGAAVEPQIGRLGKWTLVAGAAILTIVGGDGLIGHVLALRDPILRDVNTIAVGSLLMVSVALIVCCDISLVIHTVRSRRSAWPPERPYFRPLRWLVWLEAILGSALFFPEAARECNALRRHALGVDFGTALPIVIFPSLVLFVFDFFLIAHAIRLGRAKLANL